MRTRLSAKGQIVVPSDIRRANRWSPGTEFDVEARDGVLVLTPVMSARPTTMDEVFGCLKYDGPALTVEEMHEAVARSFRRRQP
ncbi:MAG: AbrB/MazE/SpoVT family DNA-binding domain-containing protein [Alphaproteobacteria bacterium]|nr:AbrB/MazE/SpoVT family DNA-binding domain-containing protein [Alphaproteobacteria bacterium]MCW5739010.1 AbrB/MazE/SpoVT family DNA-binding domain-containing protein [Alphaproteobacteria bacterium]